MEINELKAARFKFLNHLYKLTGGDEMKSYQQSEIGQDLGFDEQLTDLIGQYLKNEGLIEYHAFGPMIGITHYGVNEIEDAISNPDQSSQYFPPVVNIINISHMEGSQIQQGTTQSTQTQSIDINNKNDIHDFIEMLKTKIPELNLNEDDKLEIEADMASVQSQLMSSRPKKNILNECIRSIQRALEGAAGSVVAQQLIPLIPPLLSAM